MFRLRDIVLSLVGWSLFSCVGCLPRAPQSAIPGKYFYAEAKYETTLYLEPNGKSKQVRKNPDGSTTVTTGLWSIKNGGRYLYVDRVAGIRPSDGDMAAVGTFEPEVSIEWGKVCLLLDGNEDLFLCKQ